MTRIEVCIDTAEGLDACIEGGADRIELCSALALGGLTPSPGLMAAAAARPIPAHAMIRPLAGDFTPSDAGFAAMLGDISAARHYGLAGVVTGVLTDDHHLDTIRMGQLVKAAGSMEVTLHRAIDLCTDPLLTVDQAADLGVTRILTSGTAQTAWNGRAIIRQMVIRAAGRIRIMAGSGITPENAAALIRETGVSDLHASCTATKPEAPIIADLGFGPMERRVTDSTKVKALRRAINDA